jgi:uncharacterized protein YdaU (DUF1376 family)
MARGLPFIRIFAGDELGTVSALSDAEIGSRHAMRLAIWSSGCRPLRDDDRTLARCARCTLKAWRAGRRAAMAELFTVDETGWRDLDLEEEFAAAGRRSEAGKIGGKASANRRKGFPQGKSRNPGGSPR